MPNNNFTEDQIREAAINSYSIADMCRYLEIVSAGGNYGSIKRRLVRYDIDTSHFTGKGWNKGNYSDSPNSKGAIKKKLIRERGHQCEKCKNIEWLSLPIALELEHIDGNNTNNVDDNLLLLCPNCHAQTGTWRRAKAPFIPKNPAPRASNTYCPQCQGTKTPRAKRCLSCKATTSSETKKSRKLRNSISNKPCACGTFISPQAKQCTQCAHVKQQRIEWPPVEELLTRLRDNRESYSALSRSLGVSDNSVRKYLRKNNVDPKTFKPLA